MEYYKVVVIGATKVGKTSFVGAMQNKYFSEKHWATKQATETVLKIDSATEVK